MKKIALILILIVIGTGVWFWWAQRGAATDTPPEPVATATVETTPLAEQEIARTLEAFGVVVAAPSGEHAAVAAFDGIVRRVAIAVGTRVAVGDVLVELAPSPDAQLALTSARSAAASAEKTRADTQRRFDLNLATRPDLQASEQAAQEAQLKVTSLEARGSGGDGRVLAITAGVVSKLDAVAGTWVSAGTALVTVTGEERLEVRLGLEPADEASVAPGQPVRVVSANRRGSESVAAKVREVGHVLDPTTGAIDLRASVPPGAPLLLGEHVKATIELQRKTALVAPRRALLLDGDRRVLFTIKAGKAMRHEVQAGLSEEDLVEVSGADLHPGDQVVTLGNYELEDGMAVQIAAEPRPADASKRVDAASKGEAKQP